LIVLAAASLLPLSAALSVSDAAAATNIPTVPKVQNADDDGFPVLPEVFSGFLTLARDAFLCSSDLSTCL